MILEKIKEQTTQNHILLESCSLLKPLSDGSLTKEHYVKLLAKFYGYFLPIENKLNQFVEFKSYLPDFSSRRKVSWLKEDIDKLITDKLEPEICKETPEINSLSQAFGCLYVLEGSTLGGKVIAKTLFEKFGLDSSNGAAFFNGYGTETGSKWKLFKEALLKYSCDCNEEEIIIGAANESFNKFYTWNKK